MIDVAVSTYALVIEYSLPFALVYGIGNLVVNMILSAALGGRMCIGRNS